jgi:hypothetical protein
VLNFWLDARVQTTTREVYSIFDAIASAGGMTSVILTIVNYFISDLQKALFFRALSNELFLINQGSKKKNNKSKKERR